ncbi:post-transcriptional regulator [Merdibacter massiliensis]|uniref:post-transcriptional regulator n=1 Tax=Merdibacter massiliensis TaxID=1871030 RepID=UPI00096A58C0|nr:post-transcriptional regulator [Merdibacter massiliensis]
MERILQNPYIQLAIHLQLCKLQREQLPSLTYQHIEDTLRGYVWKRKQPQDLQEAVNDILQLKVGEIVAFLTKQVIIMGKSADLDEVYRKIGGMSK